MAYIFGVLLKSEFLYILVAGLWYEVHVMFRTRRLAVAIFSLVPRVVYCAIGLRILLYPRSTLDCT